MNDNSSGSKLFDIVSATSSEWVIGVAKTNAVLSFTLAVAATWSDPQGIMVICSPVTGATIPSTVVMNAGAVSGDHKCTGTYAYSYMPTSSTRKHRMCRWCSGTLATDKVQVFLKDYAPPTTADRKLTGLTVWA
jgi:hypothetical protein